MKEILDMQYRNYEETLVDIYLPENKNFTTIVNFHGGGLDHGSKSGETLQMVAKVFADADYPYYMGF